MQSIFNLRQAITIMALSLSANLAYGFDGFVSGKIAEIYGVGGAAGAPGNFDIRVFIENQPSLCPGALDANWAYLDSTDPNYKALLAMLLMAQASGKTINLYTTKGPTNRCQIAFLGIVG